MPDAVSAANSAPSSPTPATPRARTKIVATLGPASREAPRIRELVQAGVDVFRLNTAHAGPDELNRLLARIRQAERELCQPVGVLVDLAGPKIRLGELPDGAVDCRTGAAFSFVRRPDPDARDQFTVSYETLIDELAVGDHVLLADGIVTLVVEALEADAARCRVVRGGVVRSRQGVNLPGVKLRTSALTEVDLRNAQWAAAAGVDFVSLSFVRQAEDVRRLRELLRKHGSRAAVIAKIEKPEALDRLEEIIDAADGLMVARGDLGVEIDVARMAVVQKRIIRACQERQKPVIVATQMLESMHHARFPTRAEATDVANAILDGADACMLSGETAVGEHPCEAVRMMNRIALATEEFLAEAPPLPLSAGPAPGVRQRTQAAVNGGEVMARSCKARWILVDSHSGGTALALAKRRGPIPVIGFSDQVSTLRRMCLYWGITPVSGVTSHDSGDLLAFLEQWARPRGLLAAGDRVVLVRGTGLVERLENTVVIHEYA